MKWILKKTSLNTIFCVGDFHASHFLKQANKRGSVTRIEEIYSIK